MPQYAVLHSHEADICPMTNKKVREFAKKAFEGHEALGQKLGVKTVMEIHLDPGHRAFTLFEAKNAEAVRDYLTMAGYAHYTSMDFFLVSHLADIFKHIDDMPTLY